MNSLTIAEALRRTYAAPRYATAFEVRNATGFSANRACDVLSLSLWPSDGMHLHGFEIKVSRSDWTRELKNPQKANDIARYCDFWSLACPPEICPLDDATLPEAWGLFHWDGKKLKRVKKPAKRNPKPLDRGFLAAILRANVESVQHMVPRDAIQQEIRTATERAIEDATRRVKCEQERQSKELSRLQQMIAEFEREAGIRFGDWQYRPSEIGKAAKWLANGELEGHREVLADAAERAECSAKAIRELLQIDNGVQA